MPACVKQYAALDVLNEILVLSILFVSLSTTNKLSPVANAQPLVTSIVPSFSICPWSWSAGSKPSGISIKSLYDTYTNEPLSFKYFLAVVDSVALNAALTVRQIREYHGYTLPRHQQHQL